MNSHVVISKFIIKNFAVEEAPNKGRVYTFNLDTKETKLLSADKIGTVLNYYTDDFENYLSKNYERPMGMLTAKIKKCLRGESCTFSETDTETLVTFLKILLARNPKFLEYTLEHAPITNCIMKIKDPEWFILAYQTLGLDIMPPDKCIPIIIINTTTTPFISSINGCADFRNIKGQNLWWVPLSPKFGILAINKDELEKFYNVFSFTKIDAEGVKTLNDTVAKGCIFNTIPMVFSNNKEELDRIKEKIV